MNIHWWHGILVFLAVYTGLSFIAAIINAVINKRNGGFVNGVLFSVTVAVAVAFWNLF